MFTYTGGLQSFLTFLLMFERGAQGSPPIRVASSYSLPIFGSESELQIALIALFSEMLYRFPNMVVAQVTRESVQQAIASGITAQQVSPLEGSRGGKMGYVWALGYGVVHHGRLASSLSQ